MWFSSVAEPILTFTDPSDARWTFGRWILAGTKVELAHIHRPEAKLADLFGSDLWDSGVEGTA